MAASTNSWLRIWRTVARIIRIAGATPLTAMAMAVLTSPMPSREEMHTASSIPGIHMRISQMRMMTDSYQPPKYPAVAPSPMPMIRENTSAIREMSRDTRAP